MTNERLAHFRSVANKHKGHRSAAMIHECLDEIEKLRRLYALALDYGWSGYRGKAVALSKLKELVERG